LAALASSLWMRHWLPHLGNTFGTRHVTRPALLSLTIQVHALNINIPFQMLFLF
jgi:hypothetical protein